MVTLKMENRLMLSLRAKKQVHSNPETLVLHRRLRVGRGSSRPPKWKRMREMTTKVNSRSLEGKAGEVGEAPSLLGVEARRLLVLNEQSLYRCALVRTIKCQIAWQIPDVCSHINQSNSSPSSRT